MRISKSKLQKIINEEVQKILLEEGWADVGKGALGAAGTLGREFLKGFMGKGAASDNPISKGVLRAFGSSLVPKIDKLFQEIFETLDELDNHPLGSKFKGIVQDEEPKKEKPAPEKKPEEASSEQPAVDDEKQYDVVTEDEECPAGEDCPVSDEEKAKKKLTKPHAIKDFKEELQNTVDLWVNLTSSVREGAPIEEPEEEKPEPEISGQSVKPGDKEQLQVASEALRRLVRRKIKRRFTP